MNKQNADPLLSSAFAQRANEYCQLIESHGKLSCKEFLAAALCTLSRLYATAVDLPDCPTANKELAEDKLTHEQWQVLFESLEKKLGTYTSYRTFFNPWFDEEPVVESLADDFADIYRDVKAYLRIYEQGTTDAINEAVWHWRFLLSSHWGRHATSALDALQVLHSDAHF